MPAVHPNDPDWVQEMPNGWRIVDGIFLEEFAEEEELLFIHGKFYDGDSERSEEELRAKIQKLIKPYCATNLSNRTKSLLDGLKSECYFEPPAPAWNEIHCKNCTIQITEAGKIRLLEPVFSLYRVAAEYDPNAQTPKTFFHFLHELLYEEDIPVLQEYLGYILLPTNKAQKMMTITGRGGEGKSRLAPVLSGVLQGLMVISSVAKLQENRFLFSTLENRLLFFDDDLRTEKLKDTDLIKSLVTSETAMLAERKGKDFYAMHSYAKLLILGNQNVSALFDKSDAIYRLFGDKAARYWSIRQSPLMLECRLNGNQIIFRGVNDDKQREKLKSITFRTGKLTDVWIEEATELTQSDFEIIDDRLRGQLPSGQFYQIRLTFNPVSASHWIKRVFFDRADPDVFTHHSTYLQNRFIDDAYRRRMERRREVDPDGYRVYGLGEWGESGGLILTHYTVEEFDRTPERFDYMVNAQDFGFNHADCIGEIGFKDGELYLCREIYVFEKDTDEIIQIANEKNIRKNILMYCDSAEPDRIQMWRKAGYRAVPVKKEPGSVHAQIDYLKQHKIHIHPSCVNTIREIGQWKWKKDEVTGRYLELLQIVQTAQKSPGCRNIQF